MIKTQLSQQFFLFLVLSIMSLVVFAADDEEEEETAKPEAVYVAIDPAIIVNLTDKGKRLHFLKTDVELLIEGEAGADRVRYHLAPIRHHFIMLLSEKSMKELLTEESREGLPAESLTSLNELLATIENDLVVKEVLFTSFITQ